MSLTEAVVVAAGEIVQEHPFFSVTFKGCSVDVEALGDRIGNDGKTLAKLVDKAEDDVAGVVGEVGLSLSDLGGCVVRAV